MKKIISLAAILICVNSIAQNSSCGQIRLKNGVSIPANNIKTVKKRIRYQPDCLGCITPRHVKLTAIDTIIYNLKSNAGYSEPKDLAHYTNSDSISGTDTINFLNTENKKTWSLFSGQKVMFATSSAKYRGTVQYIAGDSIFLHEKLFSKYSKGEELTVISCNDIGKFKIKKSLGARIGGTFLKITGGFATLVGIGASFTLIHDVPVLIVATTSGGMGMYYLGEKVTTKKIIIGSKWQVVK